MVIPAQIRSQAGLRPGMELQVIREGSSVRLVPDVPRPELVRVGGRLVARPTAEPSERSEVDVARLVAEERNRWPW